MNTSEKQGDIKSDMNGDRRSAGILLSISGLPSAYGIGCFDRAAYDFVDWLSRGGQSYWQILPVGPTSYGDSPYQSFSTFAGNPYYISLPQLVQDGLLTQDACDVTDLQADTDRVDYGKQYRYRIPLLRQAFEKSHVTEDTAFVAFCETQDWLEDYALFMALKDAHHGRAWSEWERELRHRDPEALASARRTLAREVDFYRFIQYTFFAQWSALKTYARQKGVRIIGDIPIYVAYDSADVWAHPELFQLDGDKHPLAVAGCPPDGFSADGQLWGNPLYAWDVHAASGFAWWISRLRHCMTLYDVVRIDHFRGFDEYYAIPYGDMTAKGGHWERGPGVSLFRAAEAALGKLPVIAEDLGFMTDSVRQLVRETGFPNMKVLEFAFDARDGGNRNEHLPHNYPENCVAYTGTHDNQTLVSWYGTISEAERQVVRAYLGDTFPPDEPPVRRLIAAVMKSDARLCVIPMQDWLALDDRSRMNTPATVGQNWQWRMKPYHTSPALAEEILQMTQAFGRI